MVIGTLAITGVGIDRAVRLRRLLVEGRDPRERLGERHRCRGTIAFWIGALAALLTSFYSLAADLPDLLRRAALGGVRAYPARASTAMHDDRPTRSMATAPTSTRRVPATGTGGYHPHESPLTMLVPIGLLALGAVLRRPDLPRHLRRCRARRRISGAGSIAFSRAPRRSAAARRRCG